MATTTPEIIRENMETLIHALTADSLASRKFSVERGDLPFRQWAMANIGASFRRFAIEHGQHGPVTISTEELEQTSLDFQLLVAYPRTYAMYGDQGAQSMKTIMREDMYLIQAAVGLRGFSNFVAGQCTSETTFKNLDHSEPDISFLLMRFNVPYQRSPNDS